jgi:N-acetyltransferase
MQLDLVGDLRKTCKICGMEYIPSNTEDAMLHRKFHAMNVGGVDFTKAFVHRLRQNQVWAGGDGSFIAVIGRNDGLALRNRASEVLKVVNTELAAVAIPAEALWSQIPTPTPTVRDKDGDGKGQMPDSGKRTCSASDRFKVYVYIRANKCVGVCLAERILEAYSVEVARDDAAQGSGSGQNMAELDSSSISVGTVAEPAMLGISRIWTSNLHRKHGIATRLLEAARSDFLYGMTIDKDMMAFSQPTESGGKLARRWFGKTAGWHVYID